MLCGMVLDNSVWLNLNPLGKSRSFDFNYIK